MAFFGTPNAFIGLDVGSSSLKLVELIDRRRRIELSTYAQANMPNILIHPPASEEDAIRQVANVVSRMMDQAGVSTDVVVAALPSSVVFSTVLMLPLLPEKEMDKAVHFAARDVVPAELDEMVLGWSQVGGQPHMDTDQVPAPTAENTAGTSVVPASHGRTVPIFLTAAPKNIVNRYQRLIDVLNAQLFALEVETFPLVRSLLSGETDSALIVDIGDMVTTFHIIDVGTPRVSYAIEYGGHNISSKIAHALSVTPEDAEKRKVDQGMSAGAPKELKTAIELATGQLTTQAKRLLNLYTSRYNRQIKKSVLIGGGANLQGLKEYWSQQLGHSTFIGNPWKGLSYPRELEQRLLTIGPTYAVAAGLALRGLPKLQ